jgi:hypothetical protein
MPLAAKFRRLWDLKGNPDISQIAREASGLYRERQIFLKTEALRAGGASQSDIERAIEEFRELKEVQRDVLNRQYLTELKGGKRPNPPFNIIEALSLYFGVSAAYWSIGPDATSATREAEKEVELIELTRQAAMNLNAGTEGDEQGTLLVGALMRGVKLGDPQQMASVLRLALAALPKAEEDQGG